MRFFTTTALGALAVGIAAAPAAAAQGNPDAAAEPQVAAQAANDDQDIIITARRREERLQDVPVAVTAFSGTQLEQANVNRIENLGNVAPSLQIAPTAGRANVPAFAIRGQRQDAGFLTNDPSVGIYVAEAVQARVFGLAQALFDLESIQVLRGPQGTLFGRNTTGGAILIQPRLPEFGEFGGYAQVRVGNYDRFDAQGAVNLPAGDTVAVRLAYNRTRMDGWVRNVSRGERLNAEHTDSARAIVRWEPRPDFRNTLYIDYFRADAPGTAARLTDVNPAGLAEMRFNLGAVLERQNRELGFYETEGNLEVRSAGSNFGITNITEGDISELLTLKNIANYRRIRMVEDQDQDSTIFPVLSTEEVQVVRQLSEEIQLQGRSVSDRINYIVGVYYFSEEGFRETVTTSLGGIPSPRRGDASSTSLSIYAQGDYRITDSLTLTLGGRYTWDWRDFRQQLRSGTTGDCIFCDATSGSFSAPTYTTTLSWQIDPRKLVYVAHRRGYRAGGFNSSGNNAGSLLPFDPEYVMDLEVGLKADWRVGGMDLRTNLAAYRTWYDDIQRTIIVPINNVPITSIFNAASATIDGFEAEVSFRPTQFLDLTGSLAWTNPEYQEFQYTDAAGNVIDQSANQFAYIPEWAYRLAARLHFPIGNGATEFVGSVDYNHRSGFFFAEFNNPLNRLPSLSLLSARLALENVGGTGIDVALWGRNLTREKYFQSGSDQYSGLGMVYKQYGEPRTYGAEVTIRF